jgi:hypothetical protein
MRQIDFLSPNYYDNMIDLPWYIIGKRHRGYEQWLPVDDDMPELEEVDYDDMPELEELDYDDMPALMEPDDNQ